MSCFCALSEILFLYIFASLFLWKPQGPKRLLTFCMSCLVRLSLNPFLSGATNLSVVSDVMDFIKDNNIIEFLIGWR